MTEQGLRVQTGATSHVGRVRARNEDSLLVDDAHGLWAVADGMGGHERGDWASARAIAELAAPGLPAGFDALCAEVAARVHRANAAVHAEAVARGTQMGTTLVALVVQGRRFALFWVGDSRAYLLRAETLYQLSRDHTQVQEMVERGLLAPADAAHHPLGHVLTRALGVVATLELDVVADEVEPGDTFLLCSDGLHGTLAEATIGAALNHEPPQAVAEALVEATLAHGAPDNVTVIAVRFREPTMLSIAQPLAMA